MNDVRQTDIAIVGGGIAGSTAAAMLARRGIDAVLIDPHPVYPPDFRSERLDEGQLALLDKTGVGHALLGAATLSEEIWTARHGRVVERRAGQVVHAAYDTMVNAMRGLVGGTVPLVASRCVAIATTPDRQVLTLAGGDNEISARLVVMASGLSTALRRNFGLERRAISPGHSIAIGFDVAPRGRERFDFPALAYYPERIEDRIAHLVLFPIGNTTRANLFVYRDVRDPWLKTLRDDPVATLLAAMPGLARITGPFAVTSFVQMRPADLCVTTGTDQPGLCLIGDAFATSCPAAATGLNKVLTDVERLVNHHVPQWLATPGMGVDKTAGFYADPIKTATDAWSLDRAMYVRSISTHRGLTWRVRRKVRHLAQLGRAGWRQTGPARPALPRRGTVDRSGT